MADIFKRVEKKYIINTQQYLMLKEVLKENMVEDEHGKSIICNIYFDTEQYDLIRHSISKPVFKDKIRLRSYNIPNKESTVFLEIKRKYKGLGSKRRITMQLGDFYKYINKENNALPETQIKKEIDYYFKFYNLVPAMFVSYGRRAYYAKNDKEFRVTFDSNILARTYDLKLEQGNYGEQILENNKYIMEVKTLDAMPVWFLKILGELKIYPSSFSKYGTAYKKLILKLTI